MVPWGVLYLPGSALEAFPLFVGARGVLAVYPAPVEGPGSPVPAPPGRRWPMEGMEGIVTDLFSRVCANTVLLVYCIPPVLVLVAVVLLSVYSSVSSMLALRSKADLRAQIGLPILNAPAFPGPEGPVGDSGSAKAGLVCG